MTKKLWFRANRNRGQCCDARPSKIWFRAKRYGWGWTPCSWEGWTVLLASILLIILSSSQLDKTSKEIPYLFFFRIAIIVAVLIFICYQKGEKPGWRWGRR